MYVSIRSNADIIYIGWSKKRCNFVLDQKEISPFQHVVFVTKFCFLIHVQKVLVESKNVWNRPRSVELFCINLDLPYPHSFLVTYAADVIL